nr:hypothetical protein [Tanacetum cinerariifolium]
MNTCRWRQLMIRAVMSNRHIFGNKKRILDSGVLWSERLTVSLSHLHVTLDDQPGYAWKFCYSGSFTSEQSKQEVASMTKTS